MFRCCNILTCGTKEGEEDTIDVTSSYNKGTPLGISVFCLRNTLLEDVRKLGKDESSTIYDIEYGVIREKGARVVCPRDKKIGAAYVDCLKGHNNVGPATRMLSYVWGYKLGDIINSLETYCAQTNIDTKETYIWICCLCNNQHRVGEDVPYGTFHKIFRNTVVEVGHILAMMVPWDKPLYLTRIWCIFEIYSADETDGCAVEIIMPPREKDNMLNNLSRYKNLVKVLTATHIEKAEASKDVDRDNIMQLVNSTTGGSTTLNSNVNKLLQSCFEKMILAAVEEREVYGSFDESSELKYARLCFDVGRVMSEQKDYDKALVLNHKALAVWEKVHGEDHIDTATIYNNIANVMHAKDDIDSALNMHRKALLLRKKVLGEEHRETAQSYNNIAMMMEANGDLDGALQMHHKALAVREKVLGEEHMETAVTYNYIGLAMKAKGNLDGALKMHYKTLKVWEKVLGKEHPATAKSYSNIAFVMKGKGDLDGALEMHQKALAVHEKILGKEHTLTAITYYNIGRVMEAKGDTTAALVMLRKCLTVEEKVYGEHHTITLGTKQKIACL